jgi:hypothetical protein
MLNVKSRKNEEKKQIKSKCFWGFWDGCKLALRKVYVICANSNGQSIRDALIDTKFVLILVVLIRILV